MTQKIEAVFEGLEYPTTETGVQVVNSYQISLSGTSLLCGKERRYQTVHDDEDRKGSGETLDYFSFEVFNLSGASVLLAEFNSDINKIMAEVPSYTEPQWLELFELLVPLTEHGRVGHSFQYSGLEKGFRMVEFEKTEDASENSLELHNGVYSLEFTRRIDNYALSENEFDQRDLIAEDLVAVTAALELKTMHVIFARILEYWDWIFINDALKDASKDRD